MSATTTELCVSDGSSQLWAHHHYTGSKSRSAEVLKAQAVGFNFHSTTKPPSLYSVSGEKDSGSFERLKHARDAYCCIKNVPLVWERSSTAHSSCWEGSALLPEDWTRCLLLSAHSWSKQRCERGCSSATKIKNWLPWKSILLISERSRVLHCCVPLMQLESHPTRSLCGQIARFGRRKTLCLASDNSSAFGPERRNPRRPLSPLIDSFLSAPFIDVRLVLQSERKFWKRSQAFWYFVVHSTYSSRQVMEKWCKNVQLLCCMNGNY